MLPSPTLDVSFEFFPLPQFMKRSTAWMVGPKLHFFFFFLPLFKDINFFFHSSNRDTLGDFLYIEEIFFFVTCSENFLSPRDYCTDVKERNAKEKEKLLTIFKRKVTSFSLEFQNKNNKISKRYFDCFHQFQPFSLRKWKLVL